MLHRAVLGSLERFFGVLLEHTAGDLPLWLAPTQLRLLPVSQELAPAVEFCEEIAAAAAKRGVRVEVDRTSERLGKQIRGPQPAPCFPPGAAAAAATTVAASAVKWGGVNLPLA